MDASIPIENGHVDSDLRFAFFLFTVILSTFLQAASLSPNPLSDTLATVVIRLLHRLCWSLGRRSVHILTRLQLLLAFAVRGVALHGQKFGIDGVDLLV